MARTEDCDNKPVPDSGINKSEQPAVPQISASEVRGPLGDGSGLLPGVRLSAGQVAGLSESLVPHYYPKPDVEKSKSKGQEREGRKT